MKISFKPATIPILVKTKEPVENTSGPRWVSHEEAFKILDLGERYRHAHGKNYHSYAWLNFIKKLNGTHPFDNIHRSHVRRIGRKSWQVLVQKIGFDIIYPKFIVTEKYQKVA